MIDAFNVAFAAFAAFRAFGRFAIVPMLLAGWLVLGSADAFANRFGPPWQSRVSVDTTTVYSQADGSSAVVGPLSRGQIVVVVGETTSSDGRQWTQTPDGFLPSDQITEDWEPWIAEVSVTSVSIYARPNLKEP